jgi:hypothetical protein
MIGNELLKTAQTYLNPCLVKLFNAVFTSGMYPQIWSENLGGTVDNSEKYANHISSSILFSGLSLLDSRREFNKFQYSF